jgi:hypothetical protein
MAGMKFEDYVNAYYGGTLGIAKSYGIRKADDDLAAYTSPATNFAQRTDYFNTMYGASVFNQLNTESEVFKLLPKEGWTQSGWRVLHKKLRGDYLPELNYCQLQMMVLKDYYNS